MLNLYKLEIFTLVASTGSFSKAAERLYLSQPAVSQHIHDLETALGAQLFQRGPRGVTLTPAGATLHTYARCILRLVGEAERAISNIQALAAGQLRLGATPGASVYLLPDWVRTFHSHFPNLTVSLTTATSPELAESILAGKLDLAVVEGELTPTPPLQVLSLQEIELFVVVGRGHPWWGKTDILIQALNGQRFVTRPPETHTRTWIEQILHTHQVEPDIVAEFDHPEAIKGAVRSGLGVAILPAWAVQRELAERTLHTLRLRDVNLQRHLRLIWNENVPFKPVTHAFLIYLSDRFPQLARLTQSGHLQHLTEDSPAPPQPQGDGPCTCGDPSRRTP